MRTVAPPSKLRRVDEPTHWPRYLDGPSGTVLYASTLPATRLVVFIHGFGGGAVKSWTDFQSAGTYDPWWRESDLLFVGYRSLSENVAAVADRLIRYVDSFYPVRSNWFDADGRDEDLPENYQELYLLGHSLGGVVVRRALVDSYQNWHLATGEEGLRPGILDAKVRLFSPAISGFRPTGWLGALKAVEGFWFAAEIVLRGTSTYADLLPNSDLLVDLKTRTEQHSQLPFAAALGADILWAGDDDVVQLIAYPGDRQSVAQGKGHGSICKPSERYVLPYEFTRYGV